MTLSFYIPLLFSIAYLFGVGVVVLQANLRKATTRLLMIFLLTSALWEMAHAAWELVSPMLSPDLAFSEIPLNGVMLLSFLFLLLSRAFLQSQPGRFPWIWASIIAMFGVMFLRLITYLLLPPAISLGPALISRQQIGLMVLVVGWAGFLSGVVLLTLRIYLRIRGPAHRNRIKYWLSALALIVLGDAWLFFGREVVGSGFRFVATFFMVYTILTYHPLNISQIWRRVFSYLIMTLLTLFFFLGGVIIFYVSRGVLDNQIDSLVIVVTLATGLAFLFNPILKLVERIIDRLLLGRSYDPTMLVREYSANISNILSLNRLAVISLEILRRNLQIRHGTLYLINYNKETGIYQLEKVHSHGEKELPSGTLSANNALVSHFNRNHQPILQFDLDMLPKFQKISRKERSWLLGLDVEVYVPIFAKNDWVGLFALGQKTSYMPFYDHDLNLFHTLADQTAVALQNALLVEDLVKLNKDLKHAYENLNIANRSLKGMDKLKSAFIGVITHELRSPFANVDFSLQLMERYGTDHFLPEQQELFEQLKRNLKDGKQKIDNLVNLAAFLSNRGEIRLAEVHPEKLINEVLVAYEGQFVKKKLRVQRELDLDMQPLAADGERLQDAMHQLLDNAIKFSLVEGELWIRATTHNDTLRFEVQDTGPGIPADKLPTLWEDFSQMSDSFLRGVEGLGLGLTLVKYVAKAHGGDVFAKSQVDMGSIFGFEIPMRPVSKAQPPPVP